MKPYHPLDTRHPANRLATPAPPIRIGTRAGSRGPDVAPPITAAAPAPRRPVGSTTGQSIMAGAQSIIQLYKAVNRAAFLLPLRIGLALLLYFGLMQFTGMFEIPNVFIEPNSINKMPSN